jgi:hypothetical protein
MMMVCEKTVDENMWMQERRGGWGNIYSGGIHDFDSSPN